MNSIDTASRRALLDLSPSNHSIETLRSELESRLVALRMDEFHLLRVLASTRQQIKFHEAFLVKAEKNIEQHVVRRSSFDEVAEKVEKTSRDEIEDDKPHIRAALVSGLTKVDDIVTYCETVVPSGSKVDRKIIVQAALAAMLGEVERTAYQTWRLRTA